MSSQKERKRLDAYVDEYSSEESDGMGLKVRNVEGGGNNVPDESESYERRLEWIEDTKGGHKGEDVWRVLASQEYKGLSSLQDSEEIVFIEIPGWFVGKEDDLSNIFGDTHPGSNLSTFAVLKTEASEGTEAYMFSKLHTEMRGWTAPRNQYNTATVPRSVCTLYQRTGEPRPVDEAKIRDREALPDGVDPYEAEEDDYDWRLALGAAYRRTEGEESSPLKQAYNKAEDLPDKIYERVEIGVDEFMRQAEADNEEVTDDQLARVVETLVECLRPEARKDNKLE